MHFYMQVISFFRHFPEVLDFMDSALSSPGSCLFVNCVFGRSRSTTCIIAYLMVKHDWTALKALEHIRRKRHIQLNEGFLQQLADLEHKIQYLRKKKESV